MIDAASRLLSLTDAVGNVTSWSYDDANRVTTETDPRTKLRERQRGHS